MTQLARLMFAAAMLAAPCLFTGCEVESTTTTDPVPVNSPEATVTEPGADGVIVEDDAVEPAGDLEAPAEEAPLNEPVVEEVPEDETVTE